MGIKEIQAYRAREFMSAQEFIGLWLAEEPKADVYDVVGLLAALVETEAFCIHTPDLDPVGDHWIDGQLVERQRRQRAAVVTLRTIAVDRSGLERAESVPLSRDALVKAFETMKIDGPRFLYPPSSNGLGGEGLGNSGAPGAAYSHTDDFRTVAWFGTKYTFSPTQARAVELLWQEWTKGGLGLAQKAIGDAIDSRSDQFRLRDLFRVSGSANQMHPAWKNMICELGKGIYVLQPPGHASEPE